MCQCILSYTYNVWLSYKQAAGIRHIYLWYTVELSGLNTDGSFTMAVSEWFLSPLENIL